MSVGRINYSDIKDTCSNLTDLASSLSETIDNINSAINKITDPAWDGVASTGYVEKLRKLCNHLPDANKQLALSVFFLANCANGYKEMDEKAIEKLKDIIGGQDYIDNYDVKSAPIINPDERIPTELPKEEKPKEVVETPPTNENTSAQYQNVIENKEQNIDESNLGQIVPITNPTSLNEFQNRIEDEEKEIEPLKKDEKIKIPEDLKQAENDTIEYENREEKFEKDSNEELVKTEWEKDKKYSEEGIALIEVDEEERYLVEVSPKYGEVGDSIDVELEDGSIIKCVIAETKEVDKLDENYFGTLKKDNSVSLINFETSSEVEEIEFPWDTKSNITEITNNGSILNKAEATKVVEGKTFPPIKEELKTIQENISTTNDVTESVSTTKNIETETLTIESEENI